MKSVAAVSLNLHPHLLSSPECNIQIQLQYVKIALNGCQLCREYTRQASFSYSQTAKIKWSNMSCINQLSRVENFSFESTSNSHNLCAMMYALYESLNSTVGSWNTMELEVKKLPQCSVAVSVFQFSTSRKRHCYTEIRDMSSHVGNPRYIQAI